jgi:hypothetical protein
MSGLGNRVTFIRLFSLSAVSKISLKQTDFLSLTFVSLASLASGRTELVSFTFKLNILSLLFRPLLSSFTVAFITFLFSYGYP